MNLKQLEYFVDLCQTLSYTQTAKNCFVSQTAVTKQIMNLENELDVLLFDRNKKSVQITKEGELFLTCAQKILNEVKQAYFLMEQYQQGLSGNIKIGFIKGTDESLLIDLFRSFQKSFPSIRLEFQAYRRLELISLLKQRQLEGIIMFHIPDESFEKRDIKTYPLYAYFSKDFYVSQSIYDETLQKYIIYDARSQDYQNQDTELEQTMLKLCLNQGIAIMHEFVEHSQYGKYLQSIPLPHNDHDVLSLYYLPDQSNKSFRHFIQHIEKNHGLKNAHKI